MKVSPLAPPSFLPPAPVGSFSQVPEGEINPEKHINLAGKKSIFSPGENNNYNYFRKQPGFPRSPESSESDDDSCSSGNLHRTPDEKRKTRDRYLLARDYDVREMKKNRADWWKDVDMMPGSPPLVQNANLQNNPEHSLPVSRLRNNNNNNNHRLSDPISPTHEPRSAIPQNVNKTFMDTKNIEFEEAIVQNNTKSTTIHHTEEKSQKTVADEQPPKVIQAPQSFKTGKFPYFPRFAGLFGGQETFGWDPERDRICFWDEPYAASASGFKNLINPPSAKAFNCGAVFPRAHPKKAPAFLQFLRVLGSGRDNSPNRLSSYLPCNVTKVGRNGRPYSRILHVGAFEVTISSNRRKKTVELLDIINIRLGMDSHEFDRFSSFDKSEILELSAIQACAIVLVCQERCFSIIFANSEVREQFLKVLSRNREAAKRLALGPAHKLISKNSEAAANKNVNKKSLKNSAIVYEGDQENGRKEGWGVEKTPRGSTVVYEGFFREDERHGIGTLTWGDGSVYKGLFS